MGDNRGYMQRYAMLFGTYMGGFWIFKFIFFPLGLTTPFLVFLFAGLTLCVPFMGYYYTKMYRNVACGGQIGFLHAWIFTVFMYMFASLLTAVAHYIYYRFIDHGFIINTYESLVDSLFAQSALPEMEVYKKQIEEMIEEARMLSPLDQTMQQMSQNVLWGAILALPTALFAMRKKTLSEN